MIYAVIDTNVIVSALFTKNNQSPTVQVLNAVFSGEITPLYHKKILLEYNNVLHREKFNFSEKNIQCVLSYIRQYGIEVFPKPSGEILIDMDDLIFYEVAMEKQNEGSYLITGNQKHFPNRSFIISPAEMLALM